MSFQRASYETLANEAASQPVAMVTAMAERDGSNEGGLTLSREHIVTINQYANFVLVCPRPHKPLSNGWATRPSMSLS